MSRHIFLRCWEEAVGKFLGIDIDEHRLRVRMTFGTVSFPIDSIEATILLENLKGLNSRRVAILKTDFTEKPILIRVFPNDSSNDASVTER